MGFLFANFKIIGYLVGGGAILVAALWGFNYISYNAKNEMIIDQYKKNEIVYQQTIADKDSFIALQKEVLRLANEVVDARDAQLEAINKQFDGISDGLGDDVEDQAPDSLKELMRRLKAGALN